MVAKHLLDDVFALPVADRVELFRQSRDNLRNDSGLRNDPGLSPLSEEQKRILDLRLSEYEADPEAGSTWEEVEARILRQLGNRP